MTKFECVKCEKCNRYIPLTQYHITFSGNITEINGLKKTTELFATPEDPKIFCSKECLNRTIDPTSFRI